MHWLIVPLVAAITVISSYLTVLTNPANVLRRHGISTYHTPSSNSETFDWEKITPSAYPTFQPCYTSFECARLSAPLDWHNTSDSRRIAIALIKLPCKVSVIDPRYGGPIVINPGIYAVLASDQELTSVGGPGGSGINLALTHGQSLQTIVDSPLPISNSTRAEKYFDIVSFDPRGVGFSTPSLSCFSSFSQRRDWDIASAAEGLLGSSNAAFNLLWARKLALADSCLKILEREGNAMGEFMNTPAVAMDLAAIAETISAPASMKHSSAVPSFRRPLKDTQIPIQNQEHEHRRTEKFQYWGFSYGTLLGSTFAAMYPSLVGRMVLDGVVDSDRHYAGTWAGNLRDADAIVSEFSELCFEAGSGKCALFDERGAKLIQSVIDSTLTSVLDSPLPVAASENRGPDVVTYSDFLRAFRDLLYAPFSKSQKLAQIIADLSQGNGTLLANLKAAEQVEGAVGVDEPVDYAEEVVSAISCTDGSDQSTMTKEEFWKYLQGLRRESRYLGDRWAVNRMGCVGWKFRPRYSFKGDIGGDTANPILFVGNTLDPVTSFENAKKMSSKFEGSGLLQQDSQGHLSLSTPSLCTAKVVRKYFQTGELPQSGTVCSITDRPFDLRGPPSQAPLDFGDEDLLKALRTIASTMW